MQRNATFESLATRDCMPNVGWNVTLPLKRHQYDGPHGDPSQQPSPALCRAEFRYVRLIAIQTHSLSSILAASSILQLLVSMTFQKRLPLNKQSN